MSMTQEEEELVVNSIKPYPLTGVWTTPSEVPVGLIVNDGGVIKSAGKKTCKFINQDAIPHYYCDSVSGSDSNDGLTDSTPKKTVSAVVALASGPCVFEFARGSYFREQLTVPFNDSVVKAYGTGDRPIFDCADIVSGFTKTGGLTNVYQFTLNNELTISGKTKNSMWFDDIRMKRVTSQALCDSTAGSFYSAISYTGTDTIYFHSPDSVDPNSDGYVYTSAVRNYGVDSNFSDVEIYSVHTTRNGHNDGSLIGSKYIYDCYAYDGTVHNIWNGGIAEYCSAKYCEPNGIGTATLFVSYTELQNQTFRYTGCEAIGIESTTNGWSFYGSVGYLTHSGGSGSIEHVLIEECLALSITAGYSIGSKNTCYYKAKVIDCVYAFRAGGESAYYIACSNQPYVSGTSYSHETNRTIEGDTTEYIAVKGCSFSQRNESGGYLQNLKASKIDLIQNSFYGDNYRGMTVFNNTNSDITSLSLSKNIMTRETNPNGINFIKTSNNLSVVSDLNLFGDADGCQGSLNGVAYTDLTEWQVLSSQDLNTLVGDPLFTGDPSLGDFSINPSSPANTIGAGSTNYVVTAQDLQYMNVLNEL